MPGRRFALAVPGFFLALTLSAGIRAETIEGTKLRVDRALDEFSRRWDPSLLFRVCPEIHLLRPATVTPDALRAFKIESLLQLLSAADGALGPSATDGKTYLQVTRERILGTVVMYTAEAYATHAEARTELLRYLQRYPVSAASRDLVLKDGHSERQAVAEDLVGAIGGLEEIWNSGAIDEYYVQASQIADRIVARNGECFVSRLAKQLLDELIARPVEVSRVETAQDLYAARPLVGVLCNGAYSVEDRRGNAASVAAFLGKVRAEIIPGYVPKTVYRNLPPPPPRPGADVPPAGVSPSAIADPVARAKYEAALRENSLNAATNSRQSMLRGIDSSLTPRFMTFMIAIAEPDTPRPLVLQHLAAARLSESEKAEVLKSLRPE